MGAARRTAYNRLSDASTSITATPNSFACLLVHVLSVVVYVGVGLDGPHILLFLGIALAFSGAAESLPPDRRRSAGVLRILGLSILLIVSLLLVSELTNGAILQVG